MPAGPLARQGHIDLSNQQPTFAGSKDEFQGCVCIVCSAAQQFGLPAASGMGGAWGFAHKCTGVLKFWCVSHPASMCSVVA